MTNVNYLSELAELGGSNGCILAAIVCNSSLTHNITNTGVGDGYWLPR